MNTTTNAQLIFKVRKIGTLLSSLGHKRVGFQIQNKMFAENHEVTQFVNNRLGGKLRTEHWDKILEILKNDVV